MALNHLGLSFLLFTLTVSSVNSQCANPSAAFTNCIFQISSAGSTGAICSVDGVTQLISDCGANCANELLANSVWIGQLNNALTTAQAQTNCAGQDARSCDFTTGITCTLGVVAFVQSAGSLSSVNINDAQAVCGYVNQFSTNIDSCQRFVSGCVALGIPSSSVITNQIRDVTSYVLTGTAQSCVCVERTSNLINVFNAGGTGYSCTTAQSQLSSLVDATIDCTAALPTNPIPSITVFNLDFRAASEAMIRSGSAAIVSRCSLMFVPSAAASLALSTVLIVATLFYHYMRPHRRQE